MFFLTENGTLGITRIANEELLYSIVQNILLRRGEASFYADNGVDWKGIEQGYANIDMELSRAIAPYESQCKSLQYQYDIQDNILNILITIVFFSEETLIKSIQKGGVYGYNTSRVSS